MARASALLARVCAVVLAVYATSELTVTLRWLYDQRWPTHYDSFFYLAQLRALTANPVPLFKSLSLVGTLGVALTGALAIYRRRQSALPAFAFAALVLSSHQLFYDSYGFLKQSLGMFGLFLLVCHGDLAPKGRARRVLFAFALLVSLVHKSSALLALVVLWFDDELVAASPRARRIALGVAGTALVVASFFHFPHVLRYASTLGTIGFLQMYRDRQLDPRATMEALLTFAFVLSLCFSPARRRPLVAALCTLFFAANLLPLGHDAARYFQTSFWIAAVLVYFFLRDQEGPSPLRARALVSAWLVCVIAIDPTLRMPGPTLDPEVLATQRLALDTWLPGDALVVAPAGVDYMIRYFLGRRTELNADDGNRGPARYILREQDSATIGCARVWLGEVLHPDTPCVDLDRVHSIARQ